MKKGGESLEFKTAISILILKKYFLTLLIKY